MQEAAVDEGELADVSGRGKEQTRLVLPLVTIRGQKFRDTPYNITNLALRSHFSNLKTFSNVNCVTQRHNRIMWIM